MRRQWAALLAATAAVACGADGAADVVGSMMADAGAMLADAGASLGDSGTASAAPVTSECVERYATKVEQSSPQRLPGSYVLTKYLFAEVSAELGDVTAVLLCERDTNRPDSTQCDPYDGMPSVRCTLTGEVPAADCLTVLPSYRNGKAFVSCGTETVDHVVREGQAALDTKTGDVYRKVTFVK